MMPESRQFSRSTSQAFSEIVDRQPSQSLSNAAHRGASNLERKAAWPFDFYQAGEFHPVDYYYWWSPYRTACGKTQLTMMHAVAYADDGSTFAADQLDHRGSLRAMHRMARQAFMAQTSLRWAGMPQPE